MYQIHLVAFNPPNSPVDVGQLTMNATANDGSGTLTAHNLDTSQTYTLKFCPQSGSSCIGLGSFTTNASGSASFTFKFPQPGTWAGTFEGTGRSVMFADGLFGGPTGGTGLQAPLFPVQSVTTGLAVVAGSGAKLGNEPLASGNLNITNGAVTATVKGAAPNTAYSYIYVNGYAAYGGSSDFAASGALTTDANGNGTENFGEVFNNNAFSFLSLLTDNNGAEYVAGFRVQ